jgi:hypothetical protein
MVINANALQRYPPQRWVKFGVAAFFSKRAVVLAALASYGQGGLPCIFACSGHENCPLWLVVNIVRRAILCWILGLPLAVLAQRTYAPGSVLAAGTWLKLGVVAEGVYRIDAAYLRAQNIDPATIDPRTLRLYGNGGGMLPQANSAPHTDDLLENAVLVTGQADGRLDAADALFFYADAQTQWRLRTDGTPYHEKNLYCDTTYYFLTWGQGNGLRMGTQAVGNTAAAPLSQSLQLLARDEDKTSLIKSGRQWWADRYDTQTSYTYRMDAPGAVAGSTATLVVQVAARSDAFSSFRVAVNGTVVGTIDLSTINLTDVEFDYARQRRVAITFTLPAATALDVQLTYNKPTTASIGWLDWLELQYPQTLGAPAGANAYAFRTYAAGGSAATVQCALPDTAWRVWQVTNPARAQVQAYAYGGGIARFSTAQDSLRRWVAYRPAAAPTPPFARAIANQNLHALPVPDYVIITWPGFASQANRLADLHRSRYGRVAHVLTPQQIYNEFSGGAQDVTALRNCIKMFYDRSGRTKPGYVLLFGEGSYDYKNIEAGGNLVPSYQSRESLVRTASYTSDDYFSFLDDADGFWGEGTFLWEGDAQLDINLADVAVGRLPISSLQAAQNIVNKLIAYHTGNLDAGPWRNQYVLVGDYKEGEADLHVGQADSIARLVARVAPCYQLDKIYLDQFAGTNAGAGIQFPAARAALLAALNKGSLVVNYTGHGGTVGLSNSGVFLTSDVAGLQNTGRLPFWITATCEFGRWDEPNTLSGAEALLAAPNAGAIGLLTSVRLVYSFPNFLFNRNWYDYALQPDAALGRYRTLGEAFRLTKNATWSSAPINTRNFSLLTDPALTLAYPQVQVALTRINQRDVGTPPPDTLKALNRVQLEGEVRDAAGNPLPNYTGTLVLTAYDKAQSLRTRLSRYAYTEFGTVLFRGAFSITGGKFSAQFVVPLDINYSIGPGNLVFYAAPAGADARTGAGCYRQAIVCCTGAGVGGQNRPPAIRLFLNDTTWRSGGISNQSPLLLALLADELGINTTALGVGRELTAIVDGDERNPILLNDFYTADLNSATAGRIQYQLQNLADGPHTLRVKAWNVANLSATAETQFYVASDARLALQQVLNYPNPFAGSTTFACQTNRLGGALTLTVRVFNSTGQVVKTIVQTVTPGGNRLTAPWDGRDEQGLPLPGGIYTFRLELRDTTTGETAQAAQKLVILR